MPAMAERSVTTFFNRVTSSLQQFWFYLHGFGTCVQCENAGGVNTTITAVLAFLGLLCTLVVVGVGSVARSSLGNSTKKSGTVAGASPVEFPLKLTVCTGSARASPGGLDGVDVPSVSGDALPPPCEDAPVTPGSGYSVTPCVFTPDKNGKPMDMKQSTCVSPRDTHVGPMRT